MNVALDAHTVVDVLVIAFSAFQTYQNAKMRAEILALKLWIVANFQQRPRAQLLVNADGN